MSTTTDTAGQAEATGKSGGKKKLIIIGAAGLGLLLAAGGGAFFLMGSGGSAAPEGEHGATADAGAHGETGAAAHEPVFYPLEPVTVNLNTEGGDAEYLQLNIALELSSEETIAAVAPRMPRIMDAFQVYLRELRSTDLEGSAGIYRLKEELLRRVNIAVYPAVVDDILFQNILVQ